MANRPKLGKESMFVQPRHGQAGYIVLRAEVFPEIKTGIVMLAEKRHTTMKQIINTALGEYLERHSV